MRRLLGVLSLTLMLAACGVSAEEAQFNEDMAQVRDIVETAYEDGMRQLTPQEHAVALSLVGEESGYGEFEVGTDQNAKHYAHYMLFMSYTSFARGGDADFLTYLDETK